MDSVCVCVCVCVCVWTAQSHSICDPMDCSPPGSPVHGILQARILEWAAISFSRRSSQPRDQTQVSQNPGRLFSTWATREGVSGLYIEVNIIAVDIYSLKIKYGIVFLVILYFDPQNGESDGFLLRKMQDDRKFCVQF